LRLTSWFFLLQAGQLKTIELHGPSDQPGGLQGNPNEKKTVKKTLNLNLYAPLRLYPN
jgi:hypothetical protein